MLHPQDALSESGAPTRNVFFPMQGYSALLTRTPGHPNVEVGMVGREGMIGAHVVLGVKIDPLDVVSQAGGEALRVPARALRPLLEQCPALRQMLQHYLYVQQAQITRSTGCKCFHEVTPRLARWLLMCQDRARSSRFEASHLVLAGSLGVRRASITLAANALRQAGLIDYHRGVGHILKRAGLVRAACSCYAADINDYMSMFPTAASG